VRGASQAVAKFALLSGNSMSGAASTLIGRTVHATLLNVTDPTKPTPVRVRINVH
jgi:hypothetical protein